MTGLRRFTADVVEEIYARRGLLMAASSFAAVAAGIIVGVAVLGVATALGLR